MSLGFDPAAVPLHQYFALREHADTALGTRMLAYGVAEAFAEDS